MEGDECFVCLCLFFSYFSLNHQVAVCRGRANANLRGVQCLERIVLTGDSYKKESEIERKKKEKSQDI